MRDSIILYRSLREATKMLDLETRAKVYDAVMDYAFDGIEPNETGVVMAMFLMMKPIIDANNQRYENGCKGGRPKNQNKTEIKPNNNQNETKVEPNKDKDKDKYIPPLYNSNELYFSPYNGDEKCSCDCKRKAKFEINGVRYCGQHTRIELSKLGRLDLMPSERFEKPTLEQVKAYCQARNNTVDAERFMDFYESKGWKVGNQPMKDWEAAVRTWEKREQPKVELALPSKVSDDTIDEIVRKRKESDEEQRKRAEEANRRSEFIKGKGYPSMLALISAGKDVYDRVMSEYKQAQGF